MKFNQGADPAIVAGWIREVEIERIGAQTRLRQVTGRSATTPQEINAIVTALGDMVKVLDAAEPDDKIKIYARLGLRLTYDINANAVEVVALRLPRENDAPTYTHVRKDGVRGGT